MKYVIFLPQTYQTIFVDRPSQTRCVHVSL